MNKLDVHIKLNFSKHQIIEALHAMGYIYLSSEEAKCRRYNLHYVILKDILRYKLVELNSFEFNGHEYKFTYLNINQAIIDLSVPITAGLETASKIVKDTLFHGRDYEEKWVDEKKGIFHLNYIDWDNPAHNVFHIVEDFAVEREDGKGNISVDIVLFINGIPVGIVEGDETKLSFIPQLMKYIRTVYEINNSIDANVNRTESMLSIFQPERLLEEWKG